MQVSSRYTLNKRDRKKIAEKASKELGVEVTEVINRASIVEVAKVRSKDVKIIMLDKKPLLIIIKENIFPSIIGTIKYGIKLPLPIIVVDEGAVPHILNGADVMVPGIVEIKGAVNRGKVVYIADLKGRIFAVGRALMDDREIRSSEKGRAVKNVHYAGDWIWDLSLKL